jgi:hypothetical protein
VESPDSAAALDAANEKLWFDALAFQEAVIPSAPLPANAVQAITDVAVELAQLQRSQPLGTGASRFTFVLELSELGSVEGNALATPSGTFIELKPRDSATRLLLLRNRERVERDAAAASGSAFTLSVV